MYYFYIAQNFDGTIRSGITNSLGSRRLPQIIYSEKFRTRAEASKRKEEMMQGVEGMEVLDLNLDS